MNRSDPQCSRPPRTEIRLCLVLLFLFVAPLAAWDSTGPFCERPRSYATSASGGADYLTVWNRLFKGTATGASWTELTGLPDGLTGEVATDAVDPNLVYFGSFLGGLARSTDGGANWVPIGASLPSLEISDVIASPTMSGTLLVRISGDVFRSTDRGDSWVEITPPDALSAVARPQVHPLNGNRIFVLEFSDPALVHRSDDGGDSWVLAGTGLPATHLLEHLVLDPASQDRAFVLFSRMLYETVDGETWSFVEQIPVPPATLDIWSFLAAPSSGGTVLLAGGTAGSDPGRTSVARSLDGGVSWQATGLVGEAVAELATVDGRIFAFTDGGLRETDDVGDTWFQTGPGINAADIRALASSPSDPTVVVGGTQACHRARFVRSDDRGQSWQVGPSLGPSQIYSVATTGGDPSLVLAGAGSLLYRSTDAGLTWSEFATEGASVFEQLAIHPTDASRVFAASTSQGLARSTDGGVTWQTHLLEAPFNRLSSVVFDPANPDVLFAGSITAGVTRSLDGGATWQALGGALENLTVDAMAAIPSDPTAIFAATHLHSRTLWRSITSGVTWGAADAGIGDAWVWAIAADPASADRLIAASNQGVFRSFDTGRNWVQFSDGLTTLASFAATASSDGNFYVGSEETGVFWWPNFIFADGFESGDTSAWSNGVP